MDNIKKGIMFAVGLLLTIGVIGWGLGFYGKATNMTKVADSSLNDMTSTISQSKYTEYDNTVVSGTQTINAIRLYASSSLSITVSTKAGGSSVYTTPTAYTVVDISNVNYIEPTATFKSQVSKTANGTVNMISLIQQ